MDKRLIGIILSILCIIHCTIPFFTVIVSLIPFTALIGAIILLFAHFRNYQIHVN